MNRFFTAIFLWVSGFGVLFSQVGVGTTSPDGSAVLEVYSRDRGILLPRMNRIQRENISSPGEGLLVYQTDGARGFYYYDGAAWRSVLPPGKVIDRVDELKGSSGGIKFYYTDGTSLQINALRGPRGPRGFSFRVDHLGSSVERSMYDGFAEGTTFLDVDKGLLYVIESGGSWSAGIPFGKGERGDRGEIGPQGYKGAQGSKGVKGNRGEPGPEGYSLIPSVVGLEKDRVLYSSSPAGFSYLSADTRRYYIIEDSGKWSAGIEFGKGEQGDKGDKGIKGDKGDKGDKGKEGLSFDIPVRGLYAQRHTYDSEPDGFSYLALDKKLLYFREGNASGVWSKGYPFGKGERGDRFGIDQYGVYSDRVLYDSESTGFTFFATDRREVYYKEYTGWSKGYSLVTLPGRRYVIHAQGQVADTVSYRKEKEGFVYYAEDEGKVYQKGVGGSGWLAGQSFTQEGPAFSIDGSGDFSSRSAQDGSVTDYVYFADDHGSMYFKEPGYGSWSRGYFFGRSLKNGSLGQVLVTDASGAPIFRTLTGALSIDALGQTTLEPQSVLGSHYKPLSRGSHGTLYHWDTGKLSWDSTRVSALYRYSLLDALGLYYDSGRKRLGKGTRTPSVDFDISGAMRVDTMEVVDRLETRGLSVFNEDGLDKDFRVEGQTESHLFFVDAATNRLGIGTSTPGSSLDVAQSSSFNSLNLAGGDFQVKGQSVEDLLVTDAAQDRLGVGTKFPERGFSVLGESLFNQDGGDFDFQVNGMSVPNLLYVDAGNDRVGLGTATPSVKFDVRGSAMFNRGGGNHDFRVEGQTEVNLLFADASEGRVGVATSAPEQLFSVIGSSVFNQGSLASVDFTVRGATDSHLLHVDGSSDHIGMGTDLPIAMLDVRGGAVFNHGGADADFRIDGVATEGLFFADASTDALWINATAMASLSPTFSGAVLNVRGSSGFNAGAANADFRVESADSVAMLFVDADSNYVGVGTMTPLATLDVHGDAIFNEDGGAHNFRIEGDGNTHMLYVDGSLDRVGIGTDAPVALLDVQGDAVFNEGGGDHDFRVESVDSTHLFFVDAGSNRLGIGTDLPEATLDVRGGAVFNEDGGDHDFRVEGTKLSDLLYVDARTDRIGLGTSTPAARLDVRGSAVFNRGGGDHDFRIESDRDSALLFVDADSNYVGIGTISPLASFDVRGGAVFNEGGADKDFRIESDKDTAMFFLDASTDRIGIRTSSPEAMLDVRGSSAFNTLKGDEDFRVESDNEANMFFADASAQRIGLGTGTPVATLDVRGDAVFNDKRHASGDFRVDGLSRTTPYFHRCEFGSCGDRDE